MSTLFGIAGVQMSVIPWDAEATVKKMDSVISQVKRSFPWVQLIIFHELAISGLVQFTPTETADTWRKDAQSIPGPLTDKLCASAKKNKVWLAPGSMYELDNETIYNTGLIISDQGEIITTYRKMYPWLPYETGTTAGDEFCVFDIPDVGRFGLCICYDAWFPEVIRTLAWMGAEVIIHPTMTPTSDRQLELTINQANAIVNQCYFIDINGIGPWGGGRSIIISSNGRILQQAGERETLITDIIDFDKVREAREFGTLGLSQLWKQFRDHPQQFPIYQDEARQGEIYRNLGKLKLHRKLK